MANPAQITCPTWCSVPTSEHRAQLDDLEGDVVHRGEFGGAGGPLVEVVDLTTTDGRRISPPELAVFGASVSVREGQHLLRNVLDALEAIT